MLLSLSQVLETPSFPRHSMTRAFHHLRMKVTAATKSKGVALEYPRVMVLDRPFVTASVLRQIQRPVESNILLDETPSDGYVFRRTPTISMSFLL